MILMIDWGNTQLKFVKCDALSKQSLINGQSFCVDDLDTFDKQTKQQFKLILIASVRSQHQNAQLCTLLKPKSKQLFFAQTSSQACGVTCAYEKPDLLGIDRWLGILAVEEPLQAIGLISIGTAITLDIVSDKKHFGGHILPGRQLMFDSLFLTGQVRPDLTGVSQQLNQLGCSTSECVNLGVDASIYAYLTQIIQTMQKEHQVKQWVFTGGGGKFWADKLNNDGRRHIRFEALTVFIGLIKLYLNRQK